MSAQSRRQVLAGLAGLGALPSLAAAFPAMSAEVETIRFGPTVVGRVLAAKSVRSSPAFFVCANPFGLPHEDHAAAAMAADCAASGYVAVHLAPTAWRDAANGNLEWMPAAAEWISANQANGRLHPRNVFLGGEGSGADGALAWAQPFRSGLRQSRLRAVVGINGVYQDAASDNAAGVLSQDPESTSIVLIGEGEHRASTLDLGHALARAGSAFEMHLLSASGSPLESDTAIAEQMRRALQE
jgi:hypothetical protein